MTVEDLKSKYRAVLDLIKVSNVRLDHLHQDEQTGKLVMSGAAPSENVYTVHRRVALPDANRR